MYGETQFMDFRVRTLYGLTACNSTGNSTVVDHIPSKKYAEVIIASSAEPDFKYLRTLPSESYNI